VSKILRYNTLEVLTDVQFEGIPTAVFVDARGLAPSAMHKIAASLNLPEVVFVTRGEQGVHGHIRTFSPEGERSLPGPSLLGAAWILGSHLVIPRLCLETPSGRFELEMERSGDLLHLAHWSLSAPRAVELQSEEGIQSALGLSAETKAQLQAYQSEVGQCVLARVSGPLEEVRFDPTRLQGYSGSVVVYSDGAQARYFSSDSERGALPELSAMATLGFHLQGGAPGPEPTEIEFETLPGRRSVVRTSVARETTRGLLVRVGGSAVVTGRGEFSIRL